MISSLVPNWQIFRRHPRLTLGILVLLVGGGAAAGYLYHSQVSAARAEAQARAEYRAAEQALALGHYEDARRHVKEYLEREPQETKGYVLAARIERLADHYPEAEHYLLKGKEVGGVTPAMQTEWTLLKAQRGELAEVEEQLLSYCLDHKDETAVLILETLARVYARQLRFSVAMVSLNRWIKLAPDSVVALEMRGQLEQTNDNRADAINDFRRCLELDSSRTDARLRLIELYLWSNSPREALPHLRYLQRTNPDQAEVLVGLARCQILLGRFPEARQLLDKVLAAHPDNGPALHFRGVVELQDNHPALAEKWFRKSQAQQPYNPEGEYNLYLSLKRQGKAEASAHLSRYKELLHDYRRLLQLLTEQKSYLTNPAKMVEVGDLLVRQGQDKKGVYLLNKVLESDPNNRQAHEVLARYYERTGQENKARQHRERLAKLSPAPSRPQK